MELLKIISKLLNISEARAQEFIDQDDEDAVTRLNAENLKKKFDEGHKKAIGQGLKDLVKTFSTEFDFDVTGSTPEEIIASVKAGFENRDPSDITEEVIKGSDAYKELQSELTRTQQNQNKLVEKKVKEVVKEKEVEFNKNLSKAKREALNSELYIKAEKWLTDKKAVLSTDPVKRQKQIKELADKLGSFEIEKDGDGYLISKDGTPETRDGHNASLEHVFNDYDYLYTFQEVQSRESTGLPAGGVQGGGQTNLKHFKGEIPKDEAGLNKVRMDYAEKKISKEAYQEVTGAYADQNAK